MTISEAIIKVLDEKKEPMTPRDICKIIIKNNYCDFSKNNNPPNTVNKHAGNFINKGDTRVKRVHDGSKYLYYLAKNENIKDLDKFSTDTNNTTINVSSKNEFIERDLHPLFSTYLNSLNIYSKTIFHEQSYKDDVNKIWTHPDIIGVELIKLHSKTSEKFLNAINKKETFKLFSYELKREINNDHELKQAYFQAVSNSSWANYGYLVSFKIKEDLKDEIKRLNESFGIGVIEMSSYPYQCKILFQSKYKELDINTIDKLCKNNPDFNKFFEQIACLLKGGEENFNGNKNVLEGICDEYLKNDEAIENYCKEKGIPFENEDDNEDE